MLERLKTLIEQHSYSCPDKISILSEDLKDQLLTKVHDQYHTPFLKITDDFDPFCLIVIKYKSTNGLILQFINRQIEKSKKIILIVKKDFDFDSLVKKVNANMIDAIILKNIDEYLIIINKD